MLAHSTSGETAGASLLVQLVGIGNGFCFGGNFNPSMNLIMGSERPRRHSLSSHLTNDRNESISRNWPIMNEELMANNSSRHANTSSHHHSLTV
jgi:hypothetical protein